MQLSGFLLFITIAIFFAGAFGYEAAHFPQHPAALQPSTKFRRVFAVKPQLDAKSLNRTAVPQPYPTRKAAAAPNAGLQPDATSLSGAPAASSKNYTGLFQEFVAKYRRTYAGAERALRFRIFKENVDTIERLSKDTHEGMYAINNMADISPAEYKKRFATIPKRTAPKLPSLLQTQGPNDRKPLIIPDEFDWTAVVDEKTKKVTNYMQPVQYQGDCGSCWAFAAAAALEAQFRITLKKKGVKLSEAAIIACTGKGCSGGRPDVDVFSRADKGEDILRLAHYEGRTYQRLLRTHDLEQVCSDLQSRNAQPPAVAITQTAIPYFEADPLATEAAFKESIIVNGPLAVILYFPVHSQFAGQNYIIPNEECQYYGLPMRPNHAAVIVGYSARELPRGEKTTTMNVWKVRNSHGVGSADKGYFYVQRGGNACQILAEGVAVTLTEESNNKKRKIAGQDESEIDASGNELSGRENKRQKTLPNQL